MDMGNEDYFVRLESMQSDVRKRVIDRMVRLRKDMNMTQADVAKRSGLQCPNISRFESGNNNMTIDMLVRVAEAMDCVVDIQIQPRRMERLGSESLKNNPMIRGKLS